MKKIYGLELITTMVEIEEQEKKWKKEIIGKRTKELIELGIEKEVAKVMAKQGL